MISDWVYIVELQGLSYEVQCMTFYGYLALLSLEPIQQVASRGNYLAQGRGRCDYSYFKCFYKSDNLKGIKFVRFFKKKKSFLFFSFFFLKFLLIKIFLLESIDDQSSSVKLSFIAGKAHCWIILSHIKEEEKLSQLGIFLVYLEAELRWCHRLTKMRLTQVIDLYSCCHLNYLQCLEYHDFSFLGRSNTMSYPQHQ